MSEHIVELRPGQKINFVVMGKTSTPFGEQTQETKVERTYEEILARFGTNTKERKQNVPPEVREFNRFAALGQKAIEEGKWANGGPVDRSKIAADLVVKVKTLPDTLLPYVTEKAQKHLEAISGNKLLKADQKKDIKDFLVRVSKPVEQTA